MSTFMLSNASITINSVDLSSYVTSITLSQSADSLEDTAMGDTSRSYIGGLKSGTVDIEFNADFAAANHARLIYTATSRAEERRRPVHGRYNN